MNYDSYTPIDCTSDNSCTVDGIEVVQIGNYFKGTCGRYFHEDEWDEYAATSTAVVNGNHWISDNNANDWTEDIVCCDTENFYYDPTLYYNPTLYTFQWQNYQAGVGFCHDEGKALCTFDQLCPGGWGSASAVGQMNYDSYTPIDCTSDNSCTVDGIEVVQIGNYFKGTCGRYFHEDEWDEYAATSTAVVNGNYWISDNNANDWTVDIVCCDTVGIPYPSTPVWIPGPFVFPNDPVQRVLCRQRSEDECVTEDDACSWNPHPLSECNERGYQPLVQTCGACNIGS